MSDRIFSHVVDNVHEMSKRKKKYISKCHLLKILPRVLNIHNNITLKYTVITILGIGKKG